MNRRRLGVNIDHVATIRNARGEKYPDPLRAALIAEKNGESSEQIVIDCISTLKSVPIKNRINKLREIIQSKELSGQSPSEELKEIMKLQNKLSKYP